jgi:hypothetical protein
MTPGIGGERFTSAQHTGSLGPARLMAKRLNLKDRQRLLDVGGGSGADSLVFCVGNPDLSATILDFPQTGDTAKRYTRETGVADRIAHLAVNAIARRLADNPTGVCPTPAYIEQVLCDAGLRVEGTGTMLPGITMLTRAVKPA